MRELRITLLALVGFGLMASAQTNTTTSDDDYYVQRRNILGLSPMHFFDETLFVTYERLHQNDQGTMFQAGFTLFEDGSNQRLGTTFELQQRFYLFGNDWSPSQRTGNFDGVYFAIFAKSRNLRETALETVYNPDTETDEQQVIDEEIFGHVSGGVLAGLRLIYYDRFFVDLYAGGGLQYAYRNGNGDNQVFSPGYTGVTPHGGFQIGFSF